MKTSDVVLVGVVGVTSALLLGAGVLVVVGSGVRDDGVTVKIPGLGSFPVGGVGGKAVGTIELPPSAAGTARLAPGIIILGSLSVAGLAALLIAKGSTP